MFRVSWQDFKYNVSELKSNFSFTDDVVNPLEHDFMCMLLYHPMICLICELVNRFLQNIVSYQLFSGENASERLFEAFSVCEMEI